jgi:hypothetical protein
VYIGALGARVMEEVAEEVAASFSIAFQVVYVH